jgi:hypothetical protein
MSSSTSSGSPVSAGSCNRLCRWLLKDCLDDLVMSYPAVSAFRESAGPSVSEG